MRIIRRMFGIWLFLLCLLLCGCSLFLDGDYECDIDQVESVQIVQLDDLVEEEHRYNYTSLGEICDKTTFLTQLNALETKHGSSPPKVMKSGYVVIKINYLNGDYDLVYKNVQWSYRADAKPISYYVFDEDQFNGLIDTCLKTANKTGDSSIVP